MPTTLTALFNKHLRRSAETIRELAAEIQQLSAEEKVWYAQRFVVEGYADSVTSKDAAGNEVVLA